MSNRNAQICYLRKDAIEVLRTLEEVVVSLDRIGSASSEMTKEQSDAAVSGFLQHHDVFRKLAQARRILSEPFPNTVGADGMSDLEREMRDVPYWRAGEPE